MPRKGDRLTARGGNAGRAPATRRYAALLRGVMPTNAKMPELRRCFEAAGFTDVKTVLGSGNVVFSAPATTEASLARKAEAAMMEGLGRTFLTIIRPIEKLQEVLDSDPYGAYRLPPEAKRVVSFTGQAPASKLQLPIELDGARILCMRGGEIYSAYVPSPRGAVFMQLIEKTYGQAVTTRTWETVRKIVAAAATAKPAPAPRPRGRATKARRR